MLGFDSVEYQKNLICDNEIFWVPSRCTVHSLQASGEILYKIKLTLSPLCTALTFWCRNYFFNFSTPYI